MAVVVDMSDANAGFGRLQTLQENLVVSFIANKIHNLLLPNVEYFLMIKGS